MVHLNGKPTAAGPAAALHGCGFQPLSARGQRDRAMRGPTHRSQDSRDVPGRHPSTALHLLDAMLEPTTQALLDQKVWLTHQISLTRTSPLQSAAGQAICNTLKFTHRNLTSCKLHQSYTVITVPIGATYEEHHGMC